MKVGGCPQPGVSPILRNPGSATVVLGAYDLWRRESSRQTFSIRTISENGYDPQENLNDLLLLQLDREANLSSNVALVPLTHQNVTVEAGTSCQVAGWGTWRTGGHLSRFPRVFNVTVTPKDHCRPNSVCTGVLTRQGGICQVWPGRVQTQRGILPSAVIVQMLRNRDCRYVHLAEGMLSFREVR
ncbi:PREDICTED: azurocidin-like [Galeopterus variegatus]|uniref:Azurocidin-like n=1 Tax=Galeopterus variegatus TaxID=482537 RepID=A0ABM0Q1K7_GALVR|nr:PREDICTED: azurocidin-like [Galeopterus variegatus]